MTTTDTVTLTRDEWDFIKNMAERGIEDAYYYAGEWADADEKADPGYRDRLTGSADAAVKAIEDVEARHA